MHVLEPPSQFPVEVLQQSVSESHFSPATEQHLKVSGIEPCTNRQVPAIPDPVFDEDPQQPSEFPFKQGSWGPEQHLPCAMLQVASSQQLLSELQPYLPAGAQQEPPWHLFPISGLQHWLSLVHTPGELEPMQQVVDPTRPEQDKQYP